MTIIIARKAMERVLRIWGSYIPSRLKAVRAEDVFRFHVSQISYDYAFKETFNSTFRDACGIPKETTAASFRKTARIGQFVLSEPSNLERKIHIAPGALKDGVGPHPYDAEAVLAHEYIHWLSHRKFYPTYYKKGGECPNHVEGCTEWMMTCCFTNETITLMYEPQFQKTLAWVNAENPKNWQNMAGFLFKGVDCDLTALTP